MPAAAAAQPSWPAAAGWQRPAGRGRPVKDVTGGLRVQRARQQHSAYSTEQRKLACRSCHARQVGRGSSLHPASGSDTLYRSTRQMSILAPSCQCRHSALLACAHPCWLSKLQPCRASQPCAHLPSMQHLAVHSTGCRHLAISLPEGRHQRAAAPALRCALVLRTSLARHLPAILHGRCSLRHHCQGLVQHTI
jgi:hypothetical protein